MRRFIQMKWDNICKDMPNDSFSLYDRFSRKFVELGYGYPQIWTSYEAFWEDIAVSYNNDKTTITNKVELEAKYNEYLITVPESGYTYSDLYNSHPSLHFTPYIPPSSRKMTDDISMSMVLSKHVPVPKDEEFVFVWLTHSGAFADFCIFSKTGGYFVKRNGMQAWDTIEQMHEDIEKHFKDKAKDDNEFLDVANMRFEKALYSKIISDNTTRS